MTYELSGDLIATAVCHCDHCQRQGGSAFSVNLIAMQPQLVVKGDLKTFAETNDSGSETFVRRRFCGDCGSPVVSEISSPPGLIAVKAGTLDDKSAVRPNVEAWCVDRQPWAILPGMQVSLERE